tara:strand:+ start:34298 stop:34579 length:282 start_codon:yes stop_codon:yes gene_type:complete
MSEDTTEEYPKMFSGKEPTAYQKRIIDTGRTVKKLIRSWDGPSTTDLHHAIMTLEALRELAKELDMRLLRSWTTEYLIAMMNIRERRGGRYGG